MQTITPQFLKTQLNNTISFNAYVHKIRKASGLSFVSLRYGRYIFQGVYVPDLCKTPLSQLSEGAYIEVTADVTEEKRSDYGFELTIKDFSVMACPQIKNPFNTSQISLGASLDDVINHPAAAIKHSYRRSVLTIRSAVISACHEFMSKHDFISVTTPKIISSQSDEYIQVKYFGSAAALAHSPAPYLIMAASGLDQVYEIGAGYSTKHGNSLRHLNEFTRMDFEASYASADDLRDILTDAIKYIMDCVASKCEDKLKYLDTVIAIPETIPSITSSEAMSLLNKDTNERLDPTDERKLCEYAKEKYSCDYIYVTDMPQATRPCYEKDSSGFVLLSNGIEIASGGEHIATESVLDTHRYGLPPTGGAAIGIERFIMALLKLGNIREATFITRDFKHLTP